MGQKNEQAIIDIIIKGGQANASLNEMDRAVRALSSQLKKLPKDTQEFTDKKAEFQKMSKNLKDLQNDVKGVGGVFQSIGKEIKGFGIMAAGYLGFQWLSSSVTGIIKSNAQLSDSLADIRKTTGMTEADAKKLNTAFSQIDTRTATKELRNIAIVGGQLGITKGDIFGFTVAVDKMNVALGDEFTGGAEEVTKVMGGLRNVFTDIKTDKVDQDLLHIGNAINELASKGAATGPVVSDFANRIGGVGISLGLTSGQVLGLSATLQELNISTERGSTAVTRILQNMTQNTGQFAKVAGIPLKEFTELVNKDLYGAFVKVVEGSKKGNVSATDFGKTLDSLGVDGAGASEVFAKLGSNTKLLGEKVSLANGALLNTDSILAEFAVKNRTLAGEMERLSKGFASAFTNSAVSDGLKSIVGLVADLFDKTKLASEAMADEQNHVNALMIEIKSSNTSNERRLEIYDELNSINPEIVAGINRENISIQELTKNVNEYNAAQINKIAVQLKQEELDEANTVAAEKLVKQSENATNAFEKLGKIQKLNTVSSLQYKKILDDENLTTSEKIKQVYELARANEWSNGKRNKEAELVKELAASASKLTFSENEYSKAAAASNKILEQKNSLEKELIGNKGKEIDYTKLSIEQLNAYIKDSTQSMGNYHANEAAKSLAELKRRETEKTEVITEEEQKRRDKAADEYSKFLQKITELEHEQELNLLSASAKEIQIIRDKYDKLRAEAKGNKEALKRIQSLEDGQIVDALMVQFQKQAVIETKAYDDKLSRYRGLQKEKENLENFSSSSKVLTPAEKAAKETDDLTKQWDKRIEASSNFNLSLKAGEEKFTIDISSLEEAKYLDLQRLNDGHHKVIASQNQRAKHDEIREFEKHYQATVQITDAVMSASKLVSDKEILDNKKRADFDIAEQKKLLDKKIISKEQYEKRIAKIEEEKAEADRKAKREQAERDKTYTIFKIILNTALAVSKYLAENSYYEAIAAGALGIVELGVASATPLPEYAKGGYNQTSTDPQGYTTGSTLYTQSASGKPFIAGEAGTEWIASNWMVKDPVIGPQIEHLEQIRTKGYANGGYNTDIPQFENTNKTTTPSFINTNNSALESALNRLNAKLEKPFIANLNYDLMQKDLSAIDSARASAQSK